MDKLVHLGLVLLFLGIILIFLGSLSSVSREKANVKAAGGIFIGPFPVLGFFSDKKMFYLLTAIAILFFIISLIFSKVR